MRFVCIADTHLYDSALGNLPDGDVLVHTGDLLRGGRMSELQHAAQWLHAQPHPHKVVVAGNHDWPLLRTPGEARIQLGPTVTYLQDSGVVIEGVHIWGSPWQPEFHGWAFNLPRGDALADKWAKIPAETDVLVTHGPPRGYGDRVHDEAVGCDDLLDAIDRVKPALHLFGHIHEDGGVWQRSTTTLANVTTWEGSRAATVLDYEPGGRRVTLVNVPPAGCDASPKVT